VHIQSTRSFKTDFTNLIINLRQQICSYAEKWKYSVTTIDENLNTAERKINIVNFLTLNLWKNLA
jgi:hypothetical protein